MKKNKLMSLMLVGMFVVAAAFGTGITSYASTIDKEYSFNNSSGVGHSVWREKDSATKVYVYPTSGPKIYYTVQGAVTTRTQANTRSGKFAIPQGRQSSVTNYVYENHEGYARLRYEAIRSENVYTKGKWSPDSSGTYYVY